MRAPMLALLASLCFAPSGCGDEAASTVGERGPDAAGAAGAAGQGGAGPSGASGQSGAGASGAGAAGQGTGAAGDGGSGAGQGGAPGAGSGGTGQGGGGVEAAQYCGKFASNPVTLLEKAIPSAQACAERPPSPLSCEAGSPWIDCQSQRLWACGPKCGCFCARLKIGADGCATSLEVPDHAGSSKEVDCVIDILSKERLSPPEGSDEVILQIGGCNVC